MSPVGKDRLDNVMAACFDHARITDLEFPAGPAGEHRMMLQLNWIGVDTTPGHHENIPRGHWRKQLVPILRAHLAESRSFVDTDSTP